MKSYQRTGEVCGIRLPEGCANPRLPETIFTPSTKADVATMRTSPSINLAEIVGEEAANAMSRRTIAVYDYAHTVALERGIIIADTKLEFGIWNEEVILIDEVLTPDSSRFWPADGYRPGGAQPSFDKQPIRDWMAVSGWKDGDPPPEIPATWSKRRRSATSGLREAHRGGAPRMSKEKKFLARVFVSLKPTVNDPEGITIGGALGSLGFAGWRACGPAATSR